MAWLDGGRQMPRLELAAPGELQRVLGPISRFTSRSGSISPPHRGAGRWKLAFDRRSLRPWTRFWLIFKAPLDGSAALSPPSGAAWPRTETACTMSRI